MSKSKNFFFSLIPALIALGVNLAVSFIGVFSVILLGILQGNDIATSASSALSSDFLAWVSIAYATIVIIIMGIWYYKKCRNHKRLSLSELFPPKRTLGMVVFCIGLFFFISYALATLEILNPSWFTAYEELMETMNFSNSITIWIYSLIFAPLCEELVFRGITMHYASRTMSFIGANIFQAVLFGIFHMNLVQGIYAFILGLALGYVRYYGGLHFSLIFHMLFNFMNMPSSAIDNAFGPIPSAFYILIIGISLAVSLGGWHLFHTTITQNDTIHVPLN